MSRAAPAFLARCGITHARWLPLLGWLCFASRGGHRSHSHGTRRTEVPIFARARAPCRWFAKDYESTRRVGGSSCGELPREPWGTWANAVGRRTSRPCSCASRTLALTRMLRSLESSGNSIDWARLVDLTSGEARAPWDHNQFPPVALCKSRRSGCSDARRKPCQAGPIRHEKAMISMDVDETRCNLRASTRRRGFWGLKAPARSGANSRRIAWSGGASKEVSLPLGARTTCVASWRSF